METFLHFCKSNGYMEPDPDNYSLITEALITFGGRAYPKFGTIVILAGGAGSGKGFIKDKLLGIEGNTLDVDQIKELAMASTKLSAKIKRETGHDIKNFDLKNPKNVSELHLLLSDVYGIIKKNEQRIFKGIMESDPKRKPNLIFDVTLKDIGKLDKIAKIADDLGYEKQNINLVWVMNDVKVAMKQNMERSRQVPEQILVSTHTGAAMTMNSILNMGSKLKQYMDGDIWVAFNKRGMDTKLKTSDKGGMYIVDSNYFNVKKKGKPQLTTKEIGSDLVHKIRDYVPAKAEFQ